MPQSLSLMVPFQKKLYYDPQMNGSYSIKAVLPALVPELSYDDLSISNGSTAMNAFEAMQYEEDEDKILEMRKSLLEYCRMDTFAMVRILERLVELVG